MSPAEVRAAAEADPAYSGFVGDGASIPWQYFPPPISFGLLAYKTYLDALAPGSFKLHDFLYATESIPLRITREDADFTLFFELLPLNPSDAAVVYQCVRRGGAPYFHPRVVARSRPNMFGGVLNMATFKVTMLLQLATNTSGEAVPNIRRLAGWSESWYATEASISSLLPFVVGPAPGQPPALCPARAALLPAAAVIVGQRIQQIEPVGASQTFSRAFPGTAALAQDVPSMGLLCTVIPAGDSRARRFTIRGIPDARVVQGEYVPSSAFQMALAQYFYSLTQFNVGGRDRALESWEIDTISGPGVVNYYGQGTFPFAPGDTCFIRGTTDALLRKRSGRFTVRSAVGGSNQLTLATWPYGACTGGRVQLAGSSYPNIGIGNFAIGRIVQRKVGRPFVAFRGRRSKRR